MENFILAFIILVIFILLIAGSVSVRFIYRNEPVIIIDYLLFQMQLFPARKRKKSSRRKKDSLPFKIRRSYRNTVATKNAVDYLLKHSDIKVKTFVIRAPLDEPSRLTVYNGFIDSLICTLISYLRIKSSRLYNSTLPFSNPQLPETDTPTIDVSLYTAFHVIAFTFIIFAKDKFRKREWKIVGNKNE